MAYRGAPPVKASTATMRFTARSYGWRAGVVIAAIWLVGVGFQAAKARPGVAPKMMTVATIVALGIVLGTRAIGERVVLHIENGILVLGGGARRVPLARISSVHVENVGPAMFGKGRVLVVADTDEGLEWLDLTKAPLERVHCMQLADRVRDFLRTNGWTPRS